MSAMACIPSRGSRAACSKAHGRCGGTVSPPTAIGQPPNASVCRETSRDRRCQVCVGLPDDAVKTCSRCRLVVDVASDLLTCVKRSSSGRLCELRRPRSLVPPLHLRVQGDPVHVGAQRSPANDPAMTAVVLLASQDQNGVWPHRLWRSAPEPFRCTPLLARSRPVRRETRPSPGLHSTIPLAWARRAWQIGCSPLGATTRRPMNGLQGKPWVWT